MKYPHSATFLAILIAGSTDRHRVATAFHSPRQYRQRRPQLTTTTTTTTTITGLNALLLPDASTADAANSIFRELYTHVSSIDTSVIATMTGTTLTTPSQLVDAARELLSTASPLLAGWHLSAVCIAASAYLLSAFLDSPDDYASAPYGAGSDTYDPHAANEFYARRPFAVIKRVLRLASLTSAFNAGILFDWLVLGKAMKDETYSALRSNEPRRAKEALDLCNRLGPTFIKLGQALSIRTDIVPEAYALELRKLQDAVPPFDSDAARRVLAGELGVGDLGDVFETLSDEPVASASIGQVYRGRLRDANNTDVAVKVQRPGILGEIALDLHVLRLLTPIQTKLQNAINGRPTDAGDVEQGISLVDEWGRGFVAETDYRLEARNTMQFESAMRKRGLDAVCAPAVVEGLVRDKVLVTEWVEGTRLDRDASEDVPRLCGVAINAYLTMLLDTGVLHCDPHPGNLLRTTDGKLCILDWGMTLAVPDDLQYALLEFIAHINSEDYDSIPQDFINLGFSPKDVSLERLQSSGITEGLSFAFRQLSKGGGPKKMQERVKEEFQERYGSDLSDIELRDAARADMLTRMEEQLASEGVDVKGVTNVMEEMSRRNRELFALPPYVLYVARAFSTLEGIGLSIDEDYAIVRECYPYLARRLFTDKSPRAKSALRGMLGLTDSDPMTAQQRPASSDVSPGLAAARAGVKGDAAAKAGSTLSPKKLIEMTDNFASYTAATATVDRDGIGRTAAAKEFAKLLLDKDGSTLQEILVEEAAKLGDAATRSLLRQILVESALAKIVSSSLRAPRDALDRSEQLASILPENIKRAMVYSPADLPRLVDDLLFLTSEDERILSTASELQELLGGRLENNRLRGAIADNLSDGASIIPSIPDFTPGLRSLVDDAETREFVMEQLSNVPSLGRRFGAGLFRRAAYRAMNSPILPEGTRRQLSDANNRVADVIDAVAKE